MSEDFEIVSKRYVPIWREKKRSKRRYFAEVLMALASVTGVLLLWVRLFDNTYLSTPISFQVAEGDFTATALFAFMGLVLLLMALRLWVADRKSAALLMAGEVAALVVLASTDPLSEDHLMTFIAVVVASAGWMIVVAVDFRDWLLGIAVVGGLVSIGLIFVNMGLGERTLITSCLVGVNLMFYRHFD